MQGLVKSKQKKLLAGFISFFLLQTIPAPLAVMAGQSQSGSGPGSYRAHSALHDRQRHSEYYRNSSSGSTGGQDAGASSTLLKGGVTFCVPKGTPIKMKLAATPTSGLRLLDRDIMGNLHPAHEGEKLTAKVSEDIFVDNNKVIPEGTIFYGKVAKVHGPRRNGRPGHLDLTFDKLKLPDGRVFAFRAEADNFKKSTWKSKAKGAGRLLAYAGGGAIVGTMVAYQLFGLEGTIEAEGYNLAAGAAAGAIAATAYALWKRGDHAVLEPGDDLNMSIDMDLLMPAAVAPSPVRKAQTGVSGLNIRVDGKKRVKDGLGKQLLRLDLFVDNNTRHSFRSINMFLEDSNGNMNPVSSYGDFDDEMMFTVGPHTVQRLKVYFQLEWPKLKHKLVILDHSSRSRIHEVNID